jgi:CHAD domain-containing protein
MRDFDKWLSGVTPSMPVDRVAHQALQGRLAAVQYFLSEAVHGSHKKEGVHQLRIWTRRTAAALRLFSAAVPKSVAKWIKKKLRKVRRTAGRVRDCDVYLERLEKASATPKRLIRGIKKDRRAARKDLKDAVRLLTKKNRIDRYVGELLSGIAWPKRHSSRDAPEFGAWYAEELRPLCSKMMELGRADLRDDRRLHEFRIATKRVRYALELAGGAMQAEAHRRLYDDLSTVQERLGEVCDHLAIVDELRQRQRDRRKSTGRKWRELFASEQRLLSQSRGDFLQWWSNVGLSQVETDISATSQNRSENVVEGGENHHNQT